MSEYPYLWLTQTQEGEWHFIPMNEAQLQLLSSLGLDLIEVKDSVPLSCSNGRNKGTLLSTSIILATLYLSCPNGVAQASMLFSLTE